jgi:hypothetical protein
MIKTILSIITIGTLLLTASCTTLKSVGLTSAVTVGTTTGLRFVEPGKRTEISNYIDVYAQALRSITGTPTSAELAALINQFVPDNVKEKYPELVTFVTPLIVSSYQSALEHYGQDAEKLYKVLSEIALGLEAGAAPYITGAIRSG